MIGSQDEALKLRLKQMIIDECEKEELTATEIAEDVLLFSPERLSSLSLSSMSLFKVPSSTPG